MAVPERTAWSDERINDLAAEVIVLKGMPIRVATLTEQTKGMRRDVESLGAELRKDIESLGDLIREHGKRLDTIVSIVGAEQAEHRGVERATEKNDSRSQGWHARISGWIGTAALVAAVAVAVVSLIISIGSHP